MNKFFVLVLTVITLFTFSSCALSEEKVNEEIMDTVIKLIEYNWKLYNIEITYADYQANVSTFFIDKNTYNNHIKYSQLSPLILENVKENDEKKVENYRIKRIHNYDLPKIKVSNIYEEPTTGKKVVYLHMVIAPNTSKEFESGIAFTSGGYALKEERNMKIVFSKSKSSWKICDIKGNSYLCELKDKLSEEFINRYTTHLDEEVEYIMEYQLIN